MSKGDAMNKERESANIRRTNASVLVEFATCCLLTLAVTACGGGGGGSGGGPTPVATGGGNNGATATAPTVDIIRGVITGFGSVFIDGKRFDTSDATFSKDDDSASQDDLSVGMVVELRGDVDAATASSVKFEEDIKGPVDAINGDELTVLGQTVLIQPETVIDDSLDLATLVLGEILEVSGLRGVGDVLEASFIEAKPATDVNAYKVIGQIRELDADAMTFRIGALNVDYSTARLDDNVVLNDDQTVEVKDESKAYNPGDFNLIATKIEPAGAGVGLPNNGAGGRIQLEGLLTSVVSSAEFEIAGTTVRHSASTFFLFGDVSLLAVGTKVQVEGIRAEDGAIDATKVKFARNSARIEGLVEGTNLDENTFSVLGITVEPRSSADFEDQRDDSDSFDLSEMMAGDFVEVRGNSTGNRVFASEIRRDENDDTRLRGPVANIDAENETLTILGVDIVTSGGTRYEGLNDEVLSAVEFFDALNDGQTLVDAQWNGSVTDTSVAVRELSLED